MSFVLFGVLYASRCNNFHGNVAARMNSINVNKDTFKMYAIHLSILQSGITRYLNSIGADHEVCYNTDS